jgi:hypothetical protein
MNKKLPKDGKGEDTQSWTGCCLIFAILILFAVAMQAVIIAVLELTDAESGSWFINLLK